MTAQACQGKNALDLLDRSSYHSRMAKGKNKAAQMLGRLGGLKGGKARAKALSPEQRKAIAQRAAQARWAKNSEREV
ncbi:MAG: hypothetical protein ACHP7I_02160 [Terriglobales bacterium]